MKMAMPFGRGSKASPGRRERQTAKHDNSKMTNGANMSARRDFLMPASADVSPAFRLETKAVFEDGTFEGYASLFDAEDMGRDVVVRGAFARHRLQCR